MCFGAGSQVNESSWHLVGPLLLVTEFVEKVRVLGEGRLAYYSPVSPRNHPGEMSWDGGPLLMRLARIRGLLLDTALQVGTAKVVGDSGVLVDLLGLVAVIETEGETQIRLRFTPWVPPLCPSVVLTHSQGHSQHLDGCAVSTTLLATPRPEQHPGPPSLPLSRCPLPRWALSEVYGPAPRGI